MDELILADDEMLDMAPEDLPRRVLSDFAVYNSEGFCSSLELLPMWSGVDPDVDLYASGNVLDDDGEWAGGQTLSAGKEHEQIYCPLHLIAEHLCTQVWWLKVYNTEFDHITAQLRLQCVCSISFVTHTQCVIKHSCLRAPAWLPCSFTLPPVGNGAGVVGPYGITVGP